MPEETERVAVSTYVPAAQRDVWREEADALGMSQSEFLRSMVQAGRRGFSLEAETDTAFEPGSPGSDPRGRDLKGVLLDVLRERGPLEWADLVEEITEDLEDDVESALEELQEANRIRHSGRQGGYALVEDSDGE